MFNVWMQTCTPRFFNVVWNVATCQSGLHTRECRKSNESWQKPSPNLQETCLLAKVQSMAKWGCWHKSIVWWIRVGFFSVCFAAIKITQNKVKGCFYNFYVTIPFSRADIMSNESLLVAANFSDTTAQIDLKQFCQCTGSGTIVVLTELQDDCQEGWVVACDQNKWSYSCVTFTFLYVITFVFFKEHSKSGTTLQSEC